MRTRFAAPLAAALTTAALLVAPSAHAAVAGPNIVGGERTPQTTWAVQLVASGGSIPAGYVSECTGEQVNASWILTARHCIDGIAAMDVYHSNSRTNRGAALAVDRVAAAPSGDIALVHMVQAYGLPSYPTLDLGFAAAASGKGSVMGYGLRANSQSSDGLYQAAVNLTGRSIDAYGGGAQHITGVSGASNHGDSGGPLLVNGRIVAVCSTGDKADPGANTHAGSNYAVLTQSAAWIRSTAGI